MGHLLGEQVSFGICFFKLEDHLLFSFYRPTNGSIEEEIPEASGVGGGILPQGAGDRSGIQGSCLPGPNCWRLSELASTHLPGDTSESFQLARLLCFESQRSVKSTWICVSSGEEGLEGAEGGLQECATGDWGVEMAEMNFRHMFTRDICLLLAVKWQSNRSSWN